MSHRLYRAACRPQGQLLYQRLFRRGYLLHFRLVCHLEVLPVSQLVFLQLCQPVNQPFSRLLNHLQGLLVSQRVFQPVCLVGFLLEPLLAFQPVIQRVCLLVFLAVDQLPNRRGALVASLHPVLLLYRPLFRPVYQLLLRLFSPVQSQLQHHQVFRVVIHQGSLHLFQVVFQLQNHLLPLRASRLQFRRDSHQECHRLPLLVSLRVNRLVYHLEIHQQCHLGNHPEFLLRAPLTPQVRYHHQNHQCSRQLGLLENLQANLLVSRQVHQVPSRVDALLQLPVFHLLVSQVDLQRVVRLKFLLHSRALYHLQYHLGLQRQVRQLESLLVSLRTIRLQSRRDVLLRFQHNPQEPRQLYHL